MDFATADFMNSPDGPREVFLRKTTYMTEEGFGTRVTTYPVTICPARYGGTYEGAQWLAFPVSPHILARKPWQDWNGSDIECAEWHGKALREEWLIGRGPIPDLAYQNLIDIAMARAGINPDDWALQPTLDKDELRRRDEESPAV